MPIWREPTKTNSDGRSLEGQQESEERSRASNAERHCLHRLYETPSWRRRWASLRKRFERRQEIATMVVAASVSPPDRDVEDFSKSSLLRDNHPILHMNDAVRLGRKLVIMSHDDEGRPARAVQLTQQCEKRITSMRIEVAGRLIGQHQVRPLHQGPRDGDPLLLAAGQFARLVVQALAQPHLFQKLRASPARPPGARF